MWSNENTIPFSPLEPQRAKIAKLSQTLLPTENCLDSDQLNDIALVRMDRPIKQEEWGLSNRLSNSTICPICLPDKSYDEMNKIGFVTGFGLMFQQSCHTNGAGVHCQ